jgi:hypothetical protein
LTTATTTKESVINVDIILKTALILPEKKDITKLDNIDDIDEQIA